MRLAAEDTYCFEPGIGLRVLGAEEAERLQGFPGGWTRGFSERGRRAMLGKAVTVPVAEWIGRRIMTVA
jgi:site-specific DNA-cytosine methylase